MNSPWGSRGEICKTYHWTYDYLLWGISWINVMTFIADSARIQDSEKSKPDQINIKLETEEDIKRYMEAMM